MRYLQQIADAIKATEKNLIYVVIPKHDASVAPRLSIVCSHQTTFYPARELAEGVDFLLSNSAESWDTIISSADMKRNGGIRDTTAFISAVKELAALKKVVIVGTWGQLHDLQRYGFATEPELEIIDPPRYP